VVSPKIKETSKRHLGGKIFSQENKNPKDGKLHNQTRGWTLERAVATAPTLTPQSRNPKKEDISRKARKDRQVKRSN
jgi:hypothetical protein